MLNTTDKIIKHKTGLLNLAEELGNVSKACQVMGLSMPSRTMGRSAIKRKVHGRREKSWFRIGLDTLQNWIVNHLQKAKKAWFSSCPKQLKTS